MNLKKPNKSPIEPLNSRKAFELWYKREDMTYGHPTFLSKADAWRGWQAAIEHYKEFEND